MFQANQLFRHDGHWRHLHWVLLTSMLIPVAWPTATSGDEKSGPKAKGSVGKKIADFSLQDVEGKTRSLGEFKDQKWLAVVFVGMECPIGNLYLPDLMNLRQRYAASGLEILCVNANAGDSADKVSKHAEEYKITLPVLRDDKQAVMNLFGAERTPEVFLLDADRVIRYQGRIDDKYGYVFKREDAHRADLEIALRELMEEKVVSVPYTEPVGCMISRKISPASAGEITYAKHVSRIFQNKCEYCHRDGAAGPFNLSSHDDALHWADTIKEVIADGRMPPWHADPRHGEFRNDRRLTEDEKLVIAHWIDGGRPRGDLADLPEPHEYPQGWMIGEPDVVFKLPSEVTIQADGVVPYRYYVTDTEFTEDVWVQAAEARPGNRAVTHHIIVFIRSPNAGGFLPGEGRMASFLVGTAPGDMPLVLPPGYARKIPAGSKLVWQMHYTPTGKEEKDQSEVGLVFYRGKEPPKGVALTHGIGNRFFRIPPGEEAHKVESFFTFKRDATLLSFMPHMHLRGKDFEYTALFPDGSKEVLLSVPKYDFNWQSTYRLAQPRSMPKGTKIHCVAHFDNSDKNPANPDPTKPVVWGDQTWEEMMIGWIDFTYDGAPDPEKDAANQDGAESESAAAGEENTRG